MLGPIDLFFMTFLEEICEDFGRKVLEITGLDERV